MRAQKCTSEGEPRMPRGNAHSRPLGLGATLRPVGWRLRRAGNGSGPGSSPSPLPPAPFQAGTKVTSVRSAAQDEPHFLNSPLNPLSGRGEGQGPWTGGINHAAPHVLCRLRRQPAPVHGVRTDLAQRRITIPFLRHRLTCAAEVFSSRVQAAGVSLSFMLCTWLSWAHLCTA